MPYFLSLAVLAAVVFGFYRYTTAAGRRRAAALATVFPATWRKLLTGHVAFYRVLGDTEKSRFEQRVQLFLTDTRITGVQTEVDDLTRLLVAAAAVIPTFVMYGTRASAGRTRTPTVARPARRSSSTKA